MQSNSNQSFESLNVESSQQEPLLTAGNGRDRHGWSLKRKRTRVLVALSAILLVTVTSWYSLGNGGNKNSVQSGMTSADKILLESHATKSEFETSYFHFPDMVKATEYEDEIFGKFQDLQANGDGWMGRNVRVTGYDARYLHVNFRAKYSKENKFHNLDLDDDLVKFGCTKDGMILEYENEVGANRVADDLLGALESDTYTKVILSGRQIRRCPKSDEPQELLNSHEFADEIHAKHTKITQAVRRVHKATKVEGKPHVLLSTSHADLLDVFEELDFSGSTDMVERQSDFAAEKFDLKQDTVNGVPRADLENWRRSEYPSVPVDTLEWARRSWEKEQMQAGNRRRLGFGSWLWNKVVKPVVNFVVDGLSKLVDFIKSVVGTIIQPVLALLGSLIPELLNRQGHHSFGSTTVSVNYNPHFRRAANVLEMDTHGMHTGVAFEGQRLALSFSMKGRVICRNCFIRFYDGTFHWHVIIGGKRLASVELSLNASVEANLELEANITMATQVTFSPDPIPLPMLSISLSVMTIGFELAPSFSVGVELAVLGLYYKYHMQGWQLFGLRTSLLGGIEKVRDGHITETSVGPYVKEGAKLSVYLLPMVGLVMSSCASVEAGFQPTLTLALEPNQANTGCLLKWSLQVDVPIVVGVWIGLKTSFGMWTLAGFSHAFSLTGGGVTVKTDCFTAAQREQIKQYTMLAFESYQEAWAAAAANGNLDAANRLFEANGAAILGQYPAVGAYPPNKEEWFSSSGQSCSAVCTAQGNGFTAISSGQDSSGDHFYICSYDYGSQGFRSGYNWNKGGESNKCHIVSGSSHVVATSFQCMCRQSTVSVVWLTARENHNCGMTCETARKIPVASGAKNHGTAYYVCAVNVDNSWRSGYNMGPHEASFYGKCATWKSSSNQVVTETGTDYKCACTVPTTPLPPKVKWFDGVSDGDGNSVGCLETCEQEGYFPLTAGSNHNDKDYLVCEVVRNNGYYWYGYWVNKKTGYSGWMSVNENLEHSGCKYVLPSSAAAEAQLNYKCLCTKAQSTYTSWVATSYPLLCVIVCRGVNKHAILAAPSEDFIKNYVCSGYSASLGALVAGSQDSMSGECYINSVGRVTGAFNCLCSNVG